MCSILPRGECSFPISRWLIENGKLFSKLTAGEIADDHSVIVGAIAHTVSGFAVVFLWWFCLSCFDSRFSLKGGPVRGCSKTYAKVRG